MYPSGPDAVLQCWEESIGGRRAWGAGRDGESMVAGSRSRDGRTTRRQTRWTRWGLGGSGVLVMFRRGDGDGDGKRSRKVNCSQLGPGLAGWFVGFGFGSSTPKDKKTGQSVADPGSARSAVPSARPQAPQQGGQTRRWWARTGTAFDSRPCRPSAEKEGSAFNPTTLPANPVPFFAGSWDACELQRPKHQLPSDKDTCCGHQIISTKAGPVCQRGCNLISISGVFYRINIWTRKNHKDKATP